MKKIFYVSLVSVMLVACSKYENGSDFSLQSKKERISNNWTIYEAIHVSGESPMDFQSMYVSYQFNIGNDGIYSVYYIPNGSGNYHETGNWVFNSDKTHMIATSDSGKILDYYILRLDKSQLWIRFTDAGNEWELHLWPKS